MSKSLGNVVSPDDIIKKSGVDILRLWVATIDYTEDMRISDEILSNLNDNYRRIRNTFRFILGNIGNTQYKDCIDYTQLGEIDRFILSRLFEVSVIREKAIETHSYHNFFKALFEFCSVDLSAFYFDISKDTLYCNEILDDARKNKTTVLFHILDCLTTWYSPVLCHTMEEVWKSFKTEDVESVHLRLSKKVNSIWKNEVLLDKWNKIKKVRKTINSAIEIARNDKKIGSSLEAEVVIISKDNSFSNIIKGIDMENICIVSSCDILREEVINDNYISSSESIDNDIRVYIYKSDKDKCLRCWQHKNEVKSNAGLCNRCNVIIKNKI